MPDAKVPVPAHVFRPNPPASFDPAHEPTRRAGLGFGILRALGASERHPRASIEAIGRWSGEYGLAHGNVTPDPKTMSPKDFVDHLGPAHGADQAAINASCFGGGKGGRTSYQRIFEDVWIHQRWPDLCRALAGELR